MKMHTGGNKPVKLIFIVLLTSFLFGCATTNFERVLTAKESVFSNGEIPPYVSENLKDFTILRLDNGIPVIIKKNTSSRVLSLQVFLEGNTVLTPDDKPGIEALTLGLMASGGTRFSYSQLQSLFYATSSGFSASAGSFDFGSYGMTVLDSYLTQVLDAFSNTFLEPSWDTLQFDRVIQEARMALAAKKRDLLQSGVEALHIKTFAGHPYSRLEPTEDSLGKITLADLKDYYQRTIVPQRLFVVAVGDFQPQALFANLNSTFGKIPKRSLNIPSVPPLIHQPQVMKYVQEASQGVAYLRGDFPLPGPSDPDFPVAGLAFSILGDILYDVVRLQKGGAYSLWARSHPFRAPYGSLTVFKTQMPAEVKAYVDDAIGILASGRCLAGSASASAAGKGGLGEEGERKTSTYVALDQALEFYKARYITNFYEGQQENSAIGTQIALSVLYNQDYRAYLGLMGQIRNITAQDVVQFINKYVYKKKFAWVIVGPSNMLQGVDEKNF